MQETYILTVRIADGACLIHDKITGDLRDLSSLLAFSSRVLLQAFEDSEKSKTQHGFGITQPLSESS